MHHRARMSAPAPELDPNATRFLAGKACQSYDGHAQCSGKYRGACVLALDSSWEPLSGRSGTACVRDLHATVKA